MIGTKEQKYLVIMGLTHGYETCYAFDDARKNAVIILVNYDTKSNLWKQAINILQMIKFNN